MTTEKLSYKLINLMSIKTPIVMYNNILELSRDNIFCLCCITSDFHLQRSSIQDHIITQELTDDEMAKTYSVHCTTKHVTYNDHG